MNTSERYKLIAKIIRTAVPANIDVIVVATPDDDSPSVEVENGLCRIYDDNRNECWDYTCSLVKFRGLVPGVYTKPEDTVINNPIVNALLDDMGIVGCIEYGSGSLIPITFIVREDTYPADMYMIISVIENPATTVDPNTETSDDTHNSGVQVIGGLDDALGTLDDVYKTNKRVGPSNNPLPPTHWRGLTMDKVRFCVDIIEAFLSIRHRNRTEFRDFIHFMQRVPTHRASVPDQVFTPVVLEAINTLYHETSYETGAEIFHYMNQVSSRMVWVGSKKIHQSCQIVSELLNEMYIVLKSYHPD